MKNMHIPLSDEVHAALMRHAKASGESATALARTAIERRVKDLEREERRARIAAFAEEFAGTELDLDPVLEAAGIEVILQGDHAPSNLEESA